MWDVVLNHMVLRRDIPFEGFVTPDLFEIFSIRS